MNKNVKRIIYILFFIFIVLLICNFHSSIAATTGSSAIEKFNTATQKVDTR